LAGEGMNETLEALLGNEIRVCELCGSNEWRILHAGDESNCECEGECLRVCDSTLLSDDGCDGIAILVNELDTPTINDLKRNEEENAL